MRHPSFVPTSFGPIDHSVFEWIPEADLDKIYTDTKPQTTTAIRGSRADCES